MGRESRCWVEIDGRRFQAKVLLEETAIFVRGDERLELPTSSIRSARADGALLILSLRDGGAATFELGEREAALWRKKILNPPTRLEKLGVKAGLPVAAIGVSDTAFSEELAAAGALTSAIGDAAVVIFELRGEADLDRMPSIARGMPRTAHLWVLRPKGAGGRLSEASVMAAGRDASLRLSKTMRFSADLTGERFTWPKG